MDEGNPYQPPATPPVAAERSRRSWAAYLLLALPPALCWATMQLVIFTLAEWPVAQYLFLTLAPWSVAIGSANLAAARFSPNSQIGRLLLCGIQMPAIIVVWAKTWQTLVTSWT